MISRCDKSSGKFAGGKVWCASFLAGLTGLLGCDRMITPRHAQVIKDAEAKSAHGDYLRAINLYEAALDDSEGTAEIHYRLALLYDDRMNDPFNALHHFKRYLALAPAGEHAAEVKNFVKRDELTLLTSLSGDSVVTRAEAARLRNENLNLRKEVEDRSAQARATQTLSQKPPARESRKPATEARKTVARAYVIHAGDTLFSISRKFYDTPTRWKEILEANSASIDDPEKLKVGQTLTIP